MLHAPFSPPRALAAPLRRSKCDGTVHELHRSHTAPAGSAATSHLIPRPLSPGALSVHSNDDGDIRASPQRSLARSAQAALRRDEANSPDSVSDYGPVLQQLTASASPLARKRFRTASGKLDLLRLAFDRTKRGRGGEGGGSQAHNSSLGSSSAAMRLFEGSSGSDEDEDSEQEPTSRSPASSQNSSAGGEGGGSQAGGHDEYCDDGEQHGDLQEDREDSHNIDEDDDADSSDGGSITVQDLLRTLPRQQATHKPTGAAWLQSSQMPSLLEEDHTMLLPPSHRNGHQAATCAQASDDQSSQESPSPSVGPSDAGKSRSSLIAADDAVHNSIQDSKDVESGAEGSGFEADGGSNAHPSDPVFQQDTILRADDSPGHFDYATQSPQHAHVVNDSITPSLSSVEQSQSATPAPRMALRGPVNSLQLEPAPPRPPPATANANAPKRVSFGSSGTSSRPAFVRSLSSAGVSSGSRAVVQASPAATASTHATPTLPGGQSAADVTPPTAPSNPGNSIAAGASHAYVASDEDSQSWRHLDSRTSTGASRGSGTYVYRQLDSLPVNQRVNMYGVVVDCSLPTPTKGTDFKGKLVILDESRSSMAHPAVVHSFLKEDKHLIPHEAGDVLRLHRVKIVNFSGQEQIQLNCPERIAGGRPSGMIFRRNGSFSATSNNFTLKATDIERIQALMSWGEAFLRDNLLYTSPYSIDMSALVCRPGQGGAALDGYKDCLVCLAAIFVNGCKLQTQLSSENCPPGASVQLLVWDGTGPGGATAAFWPESTDIESLYPAAADGKTLGALIFVDISAQARGVLQTCPSVGQWIRLRNLSPFLLKPGCFLGGVEVVSPGEGSQAVVHALRLHQGGAVKVPPYSKDVQTKLKYVCDRGPIPPC